jgi:hypothetical protein
VTREWSAARTQLGRVADGRASARHPGCLRLTPGAICDHLEARGYITRVADTVDRRITWFELTERGAAVFNLTPATTFAKARMKALLLGLSSSDREGFVKVANAFAEALESAFPVEEAQFDRASR